MGQHLAITIVARDQVVTVGYAYKRYLLVNYSHTTLGTRICVVDRLSNLHVRKLGPLLSLLTVPLLHSQIHAQNNHHHTTSTSDPRGKRSFRIFILLAGIELPRTAREA